MKDDNEKFEREGLAMLCQFAASALEEVIKRDERLSLLRESEWLGIYDVPDRLRGAVKRLLARPEAPEPFMAACCRAYPYCECWKKRRGEPFGFETAKAILGYREG